MPVPSKRRGKYIYTINSFNIYIQGWPNDDGILTKRPIIYNGIIHQLGQSLKVSVWKLQQTPMKCKNKQVHNMSLRSVPR